MGTKKRHKRINSRFYNIDYDTMIPVMKADDEHVMLYTVFNHESIETLKELESKFGFSPDYATAEMINNGVMPLKATGSIKVKNLAGINQYVKENGMSCDFDNRVWVRKKLPDDYLYSGWKTGYRTKIKAEDLPESYVLLTNYKKHGYLDTSGVTDIYYKPSVFNNHAFKDDIIFISYTGPMNMDKDIYEECDEYVFGNDILNVVKGIEKYSNTNIAVIKKIVNVKTKMLKKYNAYAQEMHHDMISMQELFKEE